MTKKLHHCVPARLHYFRHLKEMPPVRFIIESNPPPPLPFDNNMICETARPAGPPTIFPVVCTCGDYDLKWK